MVFDDSYEHEAWNLTGEERVMLFIDFMRPLPWPAKQLNRTAYSFLKDGDFQRMFLANAKKLTRSFR